jgi:hypothetical protein
LLRSLSLAAQNAPAVKTDCRSIEAVEATALVLVLQTVKNFGMSKEISPPFIFIEVISSTVALTGTIRNQWTEKGMHAIRDRITTRQICEPAELR